MYKVASRIFGWLLFTLFLKHMKNSIIENLKMKHQLYKVCLLIFVTNLHYTLTGSLFDPLRINVYPQKSRLNRAG